MNEWKKFWWKIDLIGIGIGFSLILLYIFKSNLSQSEEFKNIWANFATELLGVWLGARIIGEIIEKKSKFHNSRFNLLRNFTYFFTTAKPALRYESDFKDLIFDLEKEERYSTLRWPYREKYLSKTEREKAITLCETQKEILKIIKELEVVSTPPNVFIRSQEFKKLKDKLDNELEQYHNLLENLRLDIWEETHPDRV